MHPVPSLPPGYTHRATLDLSSWKVALALNLVAILLLPASGLFFAWLIHLVRPGTTLSQAFTSAGNALLQILAITLALVGFIVLHELVHGLFFYLFTHRRPVFALKGAYAYAAAPGWLFPPRQYALIGLAPLLVISLLSIPLIVVLPPAWLPSLLLGLTFNAAGSFADAIVVAWVLTRPSAALIEDHGDRFSLYLPGDTPPAL